MIVLDTNVISEVMRPQPEPAVITWLNGHDINILYLTSISAAEIGYGLAVLPEGKRKETLQNRFEKFISQGFQYRILSFDTTAAHFYAEIMGKSKRIGKPMSVLDGQIAAIAKTHRFFLATRNSKDFEHCNIDLINPFLNL